MQVISVITTKWGNRSYFGKPISNVQEYTIDSAMDTDADSFTITIGDPRSELVEMFRRDSEVRISLGAAFTGGTIVPLLKGYADTIGLTHDGTLTINGRDLSAAAIDDTAIPYTWHQVRPDKLIRQRASERGFSQFKIATMSRINNLYTDGSESEWAFWYRMVRTKKMWIWVDSTGQLHVDHLNYRPHPEYYFGQPDSKNPNPQQWIGVKTASIYKNIQGRIGKVWVFGDTGQKSFNPVKLEDEKISEWIKRPLNIVLADSAITNRSKALKEAQEQIFEGMVGELEYTVEIVDPGHIVKQNTVAKLNLPQIGISGEFFIVGVQIIGGSDGFTQQVRLRERNYALTRRIPNAPALQETSTSFSNTALGADIGVKWGEFFVLAAKDWHGAWDFSLFLSALLGICYNESGFKNVREGSTVEWELPAAVKIGPQGESIWSYGPKSISQIFEQAGGFATVAWKENYANAKDDQYNPYYTRVSSDGEAGVGPMQLTALGLKEQADARFGKTPNDEFIGGRWSPGDNIYIAAKYFAQECLAGLPPSEANLWIGVAKYNAGPNGTNWMLPGPQAYMKKVRAYVASQVQLIKKQVSLTPIQAPGSTKTTKQFETDIPNNVRKLISFAELQEGKPYLWGADGPDKYDCSGLVYAAYSSIGYGDKIGGRLDTYHYWNSGKGTPGLFYVPQDSLLPGDMVFFQERSDSPNQPGHMGLYYGDGQMIVAPHSGAYVEVESITSDTWIILGGMRAKGLWPAAGPQPKDQPVSAPSSSGIRYKIMIQAGHVIPAGQSDEPYGHSGETGASGEQAFTTSVRDYCIALFSSDTRFDAKSGTAWDASAGATSSIVDDINYDGDLFVSVHYSVGTVGSGFFFGYTRGSVDGRSDSLSTNSQRLANAIATRYSSIPGAPSHSSDNTGFGNPVGDPTGASGWGYYAWGSSQRLAPNDIDHVPNAQAAVILECGLASDISFLTNNHPQIAKAIYKGICDYYGVDPIQ